MARAVGASVFALALAWTVSAHAAETVRLRAAPHPGYGRIVFDWRTPAGYEASLAGRVLTVRFARPLETKLEIATDRLPDHVASARLSADARTVTFGLKGDYKLRPRADGSIVILDLLEEKPSARGAAQAAAAPTVAAVAKLVPEAGPAPAKKPTPTPTAPAPAAQPTKSDPLDAAVERALKPTTPAPKERPPEPAPLVPVDIQKGRDVSTLRFNWRENVGAAVFRRRGQLWIVFDGTSRIDLGVLQAGGVPGIPTAAQVPVAGGSAIRLGIDPSRHARVRRDGAVWVVEILDAPPAAGTAIDVVVDAEKGGGRIVLPAKEVGRVLHISDPEVGDRIEAVTVAASGVGVPEPRRFIDVEVLESAQGIAIHPISDQVVVENAGGQIVVGKPGGIGMSHDADRERQRPVLTNTASPRGKLFDFATWAQGPKETIALSREELFRRAAVTTNRETKRNARVALARFYLGNNFGPEALGVIQEIVRSESGKVEDMALRAMRGAARVLAGEFALAYNDLRHPALEGHVEIGPWRATIAAARGDWKSAQQQFRDLEMVWDDYPPWLAVHMGILATEASLAVGDTSAAAARIDALERRDLDLADRDALAVLRGYLLKLSGNADRAIAIWRGVADSPDRKAQARARYALANTLFERKEATLDQTIDQMERLAYAWRGDVHEFDLLRRLAQLYVQRGDSRNALQTLKEAATYFREIEGVETVAQDMAETFRSLFAEGKADRLDAVTALALFDEFRELTPSGAEGDEMMRNLAERLASVDLLDEAARVLEDLVKSRLKGEEKARVGMRAATLRLAHRKAAAALAALAESEEPEISPELAHDRRLVQARALAAAGNEDEALAVLAADNDPAAERIRATVQWRAKAWKPAAEAFARLIDGGNVPAEELPALVISRAVALTLAGDDTAIAALYAKFAGTMKKTSFADAFAAVAGPSAGHARDYRAAARIADEITSLEALLAEKKTTTAGS